MSSMYSTREAFDLYVYYLALKRHFTSNYDFVKYNGKVKANATSFETRKDKFFFYKLSKDSDAKEIIFANILANPNIWVGDLLEEKARDVYVAWRKKIDSLSYVFRTDLGELDFNDPKTDIMTTGEHPRLLKLYMMNRVSAETLVILDDLMSIFRYWDQNISDTILYPDINRMCKNYRPFLDYDKAKMKKIVLDKFANT